MKNDELFSIAKIAGASIIGVADLSLLRDLPTYNIKIDKFKYGISIGVALPNYAIELIQTDNPGILYAHAYHLANNLIDLISMRIAGWISSKGYLSLIIPASLREDIEKLVGHISHKAIACAAGLGWIGRNGLLINPVYGPRIRLGSILTNMPLEPGIPMKNQCGDCRLCIDSCPTGALKYSNFEYHPKSREEIFDAKKCSERLENLKNVLLKKSFQSAYAATVCGMCIKVCPIGKPNMT
jgi:epoxyqueuosine reductase QueG